VEEKEDTIGRVTMINGAMSSTLMGIRLLSVNMGPSAQLLRDSPMEFPVYAGSANSGSFRR
jgi:hypothetical protein